MWQDEQVEGLQQASFMRPENQNLSNIIQMPLQGKTRQNSMQTDGNSSLVHSEYSLPYIVHALAHHPSCPNIDECKDVKAYEPIYRKLYVYFSILALGNEDGKPGNGLQREQVISLVSVLRNIKRSKDAMDANMSKNTYAICDLSLSIIKRLAQNKGDLHEVLVPVSLPGVLYTLHKKKEDEKKEENEVDEKNKENIEDDKKEENKEEEKKEENKIDEKKEESIENENKEKDDMEVSEGQTWLADEKALAHFDSLILEANGDVSSKINEGEMLKDSEMDGNDMPLGKMLKNLKAKGSKAKKVVKNGSTPAVEEIENNVDILGMLKEINLDNEGVSNKFDSSNGHGRISSEGKLKRKDVPNDLTNVSVPKRRRSSSAKGQNKRPSFHNSGFNGGSPFSMIKMDKDRHSGSKDKGTSGGSADRGRAQKKKSRTADEDDLEKPKEFVKTDSNQKSGPIKKRKRRRVSGLAKCTSDETESNTTDLIGRRIRVWWPMDKAFYEGVVKSYDDQKKHVVLYDDGEVEVLFLDKERWELIEKGHKPTKRKQVSSSPPPKVGSSKKKNKSAGSSKQNKESDNISPSSMVRGKRTPRKDMKRGQKGVSQRAEYLKMGRNKDSETKAKPLNKEEPLSSEGGSSAGEEDSGKKEKSRSIEKQVKDAESSSSDTASSQENEPDTENVDIIPRDGEGSDKSNKKEANKMNKSDSEENEEDGADSESTDAETPDRKGSASEDSDMAVFSDDEPLGVWKSRVGKSVLGK